MPCVCLSIVHRETNLAGIVFLAIALTFSKAGLVISTGFAAIYCIGLATSSLKTTAGAGPKSSGRIIFARIVQAVLLIVGIAALFLFSFSGFTEQIQDAFLGESNTRNR